MKDNWLAIPANNLRTWKYITLGQEKEYITQ